MDIFDNNTCNNQIDYIILLFLSDISRTLFDIMDSDEPKHKQLTTETCSKAKMRTHKEPRVNFNIALIVINDFTFY